MTGHWELGIAGPIEEKFGVGGMGIVYCARQDLTDKVVALKAIKSPRADGVLLARFLDEIRLLGRLGNLEMTFVPSGGAAPPIAG